METILAMIIIGLIGILLGMIIEATIENIRVPDYDKQETIKVIDINDNHDQVEMKANENHKEQNNYFGPF